MRFLGFFRKSEPFLEGSARCGRCASLLPDETLSYCPKCGVPFSRVPPTDQYELISDRVHSLFLSEHKKNLILRSSGIFALFWVFALALSAVNNQMEIQKIREQRSVHFYVQQDPAYPMLSNYQINQSISIAIQSFEDHFGMHIPELRISYNRSAPQLAKHPEYESKKTSLSFWEAQIFPQLTRDWEKDPYQELPVLISNFPIYNDLGKISPINTLHLNAHGLVSGLGHPALSVVSSYRMFHDQKSLFEAKDISHDWHQYLGEYVIAHEQDTLCSLCLIS